MKWWTRYSRRRRGVCEDCGEELRLTQLERCQDTEEIEKNFVYEIVVRGLPCLACSHSAHRKLPPTRDFVSQLSRFFDGRPVDFPVSTRGKRSRWIFWANHCCRCGADLRKAKPELRRLTGTVRIKGLPAFDVEAVDLCVHCPRCDTWQFDRSAAVVDGQIQDAARTCNIQID